MFVLAFLERNRPEDPRDFIQVLSAAPNKPCDPFRPELSCRERSSGGILGHHSGRGYVYWHGGKLLDCTPWRFTIS